MNYASLTTAWMLGAVFGFFLGVTVASKSHRPTCRELMNDPDWRHSFDLEPINWPGGPPPLKLRRSAPDLPEQFIRLDEGTIQRGNGKGGPSTPKPQPVVGYQPRSQGGKIIQPPRKP